MVGHESVRAACVHAQRVHLMKYWVGCIINSELIRKAVNAYKWRRI